MYHSFLGFINKDLKNEFPEIKGFSKRNLELIRQWYLFYNQKNTITKQPVSQLEDKKVQQLVAQIPWGHNLRVVSKCKSMDEALFYMQKTLEFGWSRDVLDTHIGLDEYKRVGRSVTNFSLTLPSVLSDLAQQTLKDPYNFDFLTLTDDYKERELENALLIILQNSCLNLEQVLLMLVGKCPYKSGIESSLSTFCFIT
jgi:predicted nuclease of restriction endonuclease-like (RecB) superfamily